MDDTQRRTAPLASLTMASGLSKGSTSAAAGAVRSMPALPSRTGSSGVVVRQALPAPAAAGARPRPAATASASSTQQQTGQQAQQTRRGFRPWGLPLAAGVLAFRLARSAASHVLPALAPVARHARPAALAGARVFPSLLPKRIRGGNSGPPGLPAARKPALLWFRNDLRLHDHEPLAAACAGATSLLPVYVFDPREFVKVRWCIGVLAFAAGASGSLRSWQLPCIAWYRHCLQASLVQYAGTAPQATTPHQLSSWWSESGPFSQAAVYGCGVQRTSELN
eukprot:GHRQ01011943.1.p2 GENE.GHRQ01011943.1~~GHRQ01011943.1.p2  ORF type:complete len:280 (+),score=83.57 GHRQ01011943.1:292-1131(+)